MFFLCHFLHSYCRPSICCYSLDQTRRIGIADEVSQLKQFNLSGESEGHMQNDISVNRSILQHRLGKRIKDKTTALIMAMLAFAVTGVSLCRSSIAQAPTPTAHKEASAGLRDRIASTYSRLPVTFVENRGQTDKQVRFVAQGPHYAFFLTKKRLFFRLQIESITRRCRKHPTTLM